MLPKNNIFIGWVLLLALLLRVWPLGFPADWNPDEENVVTRSLRMGRDGLNPRYYKYPPAFFYLLFSTFAGRYGVERAAGTVSSARDFGERYFADPLPFFIQGRLLSALLGTLTVWLLYLLARGLGLSRRAGGGAALVLAVSPLLVRLSHFATTDVPSLAPLVGALVLAARLREEGGGRTAFWAGVLAGVAAASKYPSGVALVGVLAAAAGRGRRGADAGGAARLALLGLLGTACAVFLIVPWPLLDFPGFWKQVQETRAYLGSEFYPRDAARGYLPYLVRYLPEGVGWPVHLAGLAGLALWLRRAPGRAWIIAAPALVYWLVMGWARFHYPRYSAPMLPALALGAAWWLDRISGEGRRRRAVLALAVVGFLGYPLAASVLWNLRSSLPDTRAAAARWIEREVPAGARVLLEGYGPRLAYAPERAAEIAAAERARDPRAGGRFAYLAAHPPAGRPGYRIHDVPVHVFSPTGERKGAAARAAFWYQPANVEKEGIGWVVLSSFVYGRYRARRAEFPRESAFFDWLERCWREAARFGPFAPAPRARLARLLGRPGPTLRVFARPVTPRPDCRTPAPASPGRAGRKTGRR